MTKVSFNDPRNAVGLLADVLAAAMELHSAPQFVATPCYKALKLSREFAHGPKAVINGYKRNGTARLYQDLISTLRVFQGSLPTEISLIRDNHNIAQSLFGLALRCVRIAVAAMYDSRKWCPVLNSREYVRDPRLNFANEIGDWTYEWKFHYLYAVGLGVTPAQISNAECHWVFKDLTHRAHKSKTLKAAFEAAWIAENYEFAERLVQSE